jgi:hypothetical protein
LKLGKLIVVEIAIAAIVLLVVIVAIQGIPSFGSASQSSTVSMYQQKVYSSGSETLGVGETARTRFNYTTYDPAILTIDLQFHDWQKNGNLTLYCNGREITTVFASPEKPDIHINAISFSGADWVQPSSASWPTLGSFFAYGNEVSFVSGSGGFSGSFDYVVSVRGSR